VVAEKIYTFSHLEIGLIDSTMHSPAGHKSEEQTEKQPTNQGKNMLQPTIQQELCRHDDKSRREEYASVMSDVHLRQHSLPTMMTRWDCGDSISKMELAAVFCSNSALHKHRDGEHRKDNNAEGAGYYYIRSQSTPHLVLQPPPPSKQERWQSSSCSSKTAKNGAAVGGGVDRPPTLKREKSFGSSSLYNASFPLRSRDEAIEPWFAASADQQQQAAVAVSVEPKADLMMSFLAQGSRDRTPRVQPIVGILARQVSPMSSAAAASSSQNMKDILSSAIAIIDDEGIEF
jgi:hypothetical protein